MAKGSQDAASRAVLAWGVVGSGQDYARAWVEGAILDKTEI